MQTIIRLIKRFFLDILKTVKEFFVLLLGVGLFVYNLFNFASDRYCDNDGNLPSISHFFECYNSATYYYYDHQTLILLVIGAILIAIGLLKVKKR